MRKAGQKKADQRRDQGCCWWLVGRKKKSREDMGRPWSYTLTEERGGREQPGGAQVKVNLIPKEDAGVLLSPSPLPLVDTQRSELKAGAQP
jgi:hypothetical protein